jgi:hypothetical protein
MVTSEVSPEPFTVLPNKVTLQVSADGATWVNATGINKAWATADDAVTNQKKPDLKSASLNSSIISYLS